MPRHSGYIELATLKYPVFPGEIMGKHPEIQTTSFDEDFPYPSTYAIVWNTDPPACNFDTQALEQGAPEQIDGQWYQTWVVRELSQQEIALNAETAAMVAARIAEAEALIAAAAPLTAGTVEII